VGTRDGLDGNRSGRALRPRRLVGREREVAEVTESVVAVAVTTLVGPGGVGKTALATTVAAAAAEQFSGGVFVVWLGCLRSAELVVAEAAAQVGLARSAGHFYEDALTE
jgi:predicted ATPase